MRAHCNPLDISPTARPGSLSTLLDWVKSPLAGCSLFALCIAHCSQFEHSGDFTMQSKPGGGGGGALPMLGSTSC